MEERLGKADGRSVTRYWEGILECVGKRIC